MTTPSPASVGAHPPRGLALAIMLLRALCGAIVGLILFGVAVLLLGQWKLGHISAVLWSLAFLKGRTTAAIAGAIVGTIVARYFHHRRARTVFDRPSAVRVMAARALAGHVGARRVRDLALTFGTLLLVIALGLLAADSLGLPDAAGGLLLVVPLAAIGARLLFTRA